MFACDEIIKKISLDKKKLVERFHTFVRLIQTVGENKINLLFVKTEENKTCLF